MRSLSPLVIAHSERIETGLLLFSPSVQERRAPHRRIEDWSGFAKTPPPLRGRDESSSLSPSAREKRRVLLSFTFGEREETSPPLFHLRRERRDESSSLSPSAREKRRVLLSFTFGEREETSPPLFHLRRERRDESSSLSPSAREKRRVLLSFTFGEREETSPPLFHLRRERRDESSSLSPSAREKRRVLLSFTFGEREETSPPLFHLRRERRDESSSRLCREETSPLSFSPLVIAFGFFTEGEKSDRDDSWSLKGAENLNKRIEKKNCLRWCETKKAFVCRRLKHAQTKLDSTEFFQKREVANIKNDSSQKPCSPLPFD